MTKTSRASNGGTVCHILQRRHGRSTVFCQSADSDAGVQRLPAANHRVSLRLAEYPVLFLWLACVAILTAGSLRADEPSAEAGAKGARWAVIVVGLPGDAEHGERFREVVRSWRKWLVESLDFDPQHVLVLDGKGGEETRLATRASIQETFAKLNSDLREQDALWVFFLGHANYDGARAFFHVAGPDPDAASLGKWLSSVKCREQIVWLTNSCAGWFVKPLAKTGRIVIAATAADFEFNDTEFPQALATVTTKSLAELDRDQDERVSLLELFAAVVKETDQIFQADKRIPTEHAQLDDDGDGQGSELSDLWKTVAENAATAVGDSAAKSDALTTKTPNTPKRTDGRLAAKTFVPYRAAGKSDPHSNSPSSKKTPQAEQAP